VSHLCPANLKSLFLKFLLVIIIIVFVIVIYVHLIKTTCNKFMNKAGLL
jgi:hypothetical protein